jgi:hypothetical protein
MSVHIGELHTDVATSGTSQATDGRDPRDAVDSAEERAREARRRGEWLERRVAAEGFDD